MECGKLRAKCLLLLASFTLHEIIFSNSSNTSRRTPLISKHREELKIQGEAEHF